MIRAFYYVESHAKNIEEIFCMLSKIATQFYYLLLVVYSHLGPDIVSLACPERSRRARFVSCERRGAYTKQNQ